MRRIARPLFTLCSAASLLLCGLLLLPWIGLGDFGFRVGLPLIAGFAIAPVYWLVDRSLLFRADKRKALGLCPTCGYGLRASPNRCPECDAAPEVTT